MIESVEVVEIADILEIGSQANGARQDSFALFEGAFIKIRLCS
jgi:hypothetical protein